jgi:catechol 2,3-dioxygenase-like lactoylglutathione lyase family enzyme
MLGKSDAVATVAVRDLAVGRKFYEQTLGLKAVHTEGDEAVTFQSGSGRLMVYRSQFAGTNRATGVHFMVGANIDPVVKGLKDKGVAFEHYDLPGLTLQGDVHVAGDFKTAWFKDLDGNILALVNR